ncbi:MAG: ribokinase [Propionicimonas sp.]|nr:ribokinase [Propionicimonas sp.]
MRIAVVGSYGVGLTMRVARTPEPGETLTGGVFSSGHGGKGSNQAIAAARLGAEVALLTAVGPDPFGDRARELWRAEGVAADKVVTAAASTMVGVIVVEPSGENRIVIAPGALDRLSPADVDAFEDEIAAADVLVTGFEIPVAVARRALQLARRHRVRTLLNPAPAPPEPLDAELWGLVDVLTPNRTEAARLTGEPGLDSPRACAAAIRHRYRGITIVTLGGAGCLVDEPGVGPRLVPPVPARQVVDTTGAGDAFAGALAVALARGDGLEAAVRFASAAGAHAVGIAEVIPSLPHPGDLAMLLEAGG